MLWYCWQTLKHYWHIESDIIFNQITNISPDWDSWLKDSSCSAITLKQPSFNKRNVLVSPADSGIESDIIFFWFTKNFNPKWKIDLKMCHILPLLQINSISTKAQRSNTATSASRIHVIICCLSQISNSLCSPKFLSEGQNGLKIHFIKRLLPSNEIHLLGFKTPCN